MNLLQAITLAGFVGFMTVVLGILVKVVGFPDQIRKNYQKKSTEGISTTCFLLSFLAYVFWTLHGVLMHDKVLIIGQGLGIITTGAILGQIFLYRKKK